MGANISATFDDASNEAVIACSACGERRIAKELVGSSDLQKAIFLHRVGAREAGIEPCRDPGPFVSEHGEHVVNVVLQHEQCELVLRKVTARVHGPFTSDRDDCVQRIQCGHDEYEVVIRQMSGDRSRSIHRSDVAVLNSKTGQTVCLLCPEEGALITSGVAVGDQLTAMVQNHFASRHSEVFLRVRDDDKTITFRLTSN